MMRHLSGRGVGAGLIRQTANVTDVLRVTENHARERSPWKQVAKKRYDRFGPFFRNAPTRERGAS